MKKWIIYVGMPIISVIVVASILIWVISSRYDIYTISPEACTTLFYLSPEEFCEKSGRDTELQNEYTYARVDRKGNLILVLDAVQLENWTDWTEEFLGRMSNKSNVSTKDHTYVGLFPNKDDFMSGADSAGFSVSSDYSKVTVEYDADFSYLFIVLPSCVKMQIVDGKAMEKISVQFIFKGKSEGEIQYQSVWPEDDTIYKSGLGAK